MVELFRKLFLLERPSFSLSLFRVAVAVTVGVHVFPILLQLHENFSPDTFKIFNTSFFTPEAVLWVNKSPVWLIGGLAWLFALAWLCFFVGLLSQVSCIVMTACCYYFYALNAFQIGTLSWDILLVVLFLMCVTPYHGDYFSLDSLLRRDELAYKKTRPFFIQRLLQLQIGFIYFYTAFYKITAEGNWLQDNPIYYLMNYPVEGVTKTFILKDFLWDKPELCSFIGTTIIILELLMLFLLFIPKTRMSGIYLGFVFHIALILTLDVPSIFFFLFPAQLLLFINPERIVERIDYARAQNKRQPHFKLIYDGKCGFCLASVEFLKVMDLFGRVSFINYHEVENLKDLHPDLSLTMASSQLCLVGRDHLLRGGFEAIRYLSIFLPMLYSAAVIFYFPGMGIIGPWIYKLIAKNRYVLRLAGLCQNNSCYR